MPVTLFEVDELWALTSERLMHPISQATVDDAEGPVPKARRTTQEGGTDTSQQRVILVTEPHTDINAGFVVVMDSGHFPPLGFEVVDEQASTLDDDIAEEFWLNLAINHSRPTEALRLNTFVTSMILRPCRLKNRYFPPCRARHDSSDGRSTT